MTNEEAEKRSEHYAKLERNGSISMLIQEAYTSFLGTPFNLANTWGAPVGDCRRPRSWQGEPIPTQIGILTKSPDGEIAWLADSRVAPRGMKADGGEVKTGWNRWQANTDYKVMLVMFDLDVAKHGGENDPHPCQIEGAPNGIVPAWMSSHGWSTPIQELLSVAIWRTGFNCGRKMGTAQALAHHAAAMTKDAERGELYGG